MNETNINAMERQLDKKNEYNNKRQRTKNVLQYFFTSNYNVRFILDHCKMFKHSVILFHIE